MLIREKSSGILVCECSGCSLGGVLLGGLRGTGGGVPEGNSAEDLRPKPPRGTLRNLRCSKYPEGLAGTLIDFFNFNVLSSDLSSKPERLGDGRSVSGSLLSQTKVSTRFIGVGDVSW